MVITGLNKLFNLAPLHLERKAAMMLHAHGCCNHCKREQD
jgi:hypothetical protein